MAVEKNGRAATGFQRRRRCSVGLSGCRRWLVQRLQTTDVAGLANMMGLVGPLRDALTVLGMTCYTVATVAVAGLQTHIVEIMAAAAASEL